MTTAPQGAEPAAVNPGRAADQLKEAADLTASGRPCRKGIRVRIGPMSYQVLARKLRPADFASLVGQEHIVRALRHGLDAGRLHHAYLFTGTRGVGKTTVARILAKCLNCEAGVSSTPCGQCSVCVEVQENRFVDLIEVDAASRTRVDDTRELLENAQYLPARGRYKIYLIDEVHMLSTSSFNALLKTLEEPPDHVKFLLATTDPKKVPITVLSRCLQFQLKNISKKRIAGYLAEAMTAEGVEFEQEALELIAKSAQGSMRDALSVTDQAIAFGQGKLAARDVADLLGAVGRDEIAAVLDALGSGSAKAVVDLSAELAERGADFAATLAELLQALHDVAVAKALGAAAEPALNKAGAGMTAEAVQLYYQIALLGYRDMRVGPDPKTAFEMTLLRMLAFAPDAASAAAVPPAASVGEPAADPSAKGPSRSAAASTGAGQRRAAEPPAAPQPSAAPLEGAEPDKALAAEWRGLVGRADLNGSAKAVAERCILVEKTEELLRLRLDQAHTAMLTSDQAPAIAQALAPLCGPVRVVIETGELSVESAAEHRRRTQAERREAARRRFEQDEVVRSLIKGFGGQVVDAHYLEPAGRGLGGLA